MEVEKGKALVWFRNDLRIHDHEPLFRAARQYEEVLTVYCIDPRLQAQTSAGFKKTGVFRAGFLLDSLNNLNENLKAIGGRLIILKGKPEVEIPEFAKTHQIKRVYYSGEQCIEEQMIERSLEKELWKLQIPLSCYITNSLIHPADLPYPVKALPDIFTEFRKSVETFCKPRPCFPAPTTINSQQVNSTQQVPCLADLGYDISPLETEEYAKRAFHQKGGETAALNRIQSYFFENKHLSNYKETRNGLLGSDYSSKLSAYLAFGCISPRYVYEQVKQYEKDIESNDSTYWLIFELLWRDYFKYVARKYGNKIFQPQGIKGISLSAKYHSKKDETFVKWVNGETGDDFVDANMKELLHTGFMSNRGRQNVASYLVKDLKVNWLLGAQWFEEMLIDYDPCSNYGNWNYVAGIGNDPRENRYFNTQKQALTYDPKGSYRAYWLNSSKVVKV